VLSGVRDPVVFERLRGHLRPFEDELLVTEDYEAAARAHNACRAAGISGSAVDFLVCAVAERRKLAIFTTDRDFEGYSRVLPIRLHGLATVGERARGTPA
jgi:predicted nucleic acid-binding protein